jgi:prevent-host-death family protein
MTTVGILEAKTHLSALVDQVQAGQEVTITRHGRPVVRLVAAVNAVNTERSRAAFARIMERRKAMKSSGLSWQELKAMRDEGRP